MKRTTKEVYYAEKRSRKRRTTQGSKCYFYQRWFCKDCQRPFKPSRNNKGKINFSFKVKICNLYYDSEASYRAVHRQFKGIISDLLPEFFGVSQRLLPKIPHQFCTYHALKATERYVKYHYSGGDKFWANRFLFVTKIICQCKTLETAQRALAYLERHQEELRRAKLLKRMNILRLRFPHLIKRFQDPNLRPDNNIIENVIRQLNQKFKKVAGFERRNTAFNSISLLIIHYRFHKFTCSRIPGNNGKSPLEIAGVDTSHLNWVRFSQRS